MCLLAQAKERSNLTPHNHMDKVIHQLMYVSSANHLLDEDELTKILSAAQTNNAYNDITGILLHSDGNILQLIEGPEHAVEELFSKIENDERHTQIMVLYRKQVQSRDFLLFKMGFRNPSHKRLAEEFPAYSDIVENRSLPAETMDKLSVRVATFLRTFARTTQLER